MACDLQLPSHSLVSVDLQWSSFDKLRWSSSGQLGNVDMGDQRNLLDRFRASIDSYFIC